MSMTLNPVNEAAFQKAVQSLETLNRAAVFHPTGTGSGSRSTSRSTWV
mgnify:CR=1 FL=1